MADSFAYYLQDAKCYWLKKEKSSILYGLGVERYAHNNIAFTPNFPVNYSWDYKAGYWCFVRVIDAQVN
jgi:hypothetical protein